MTQIAKIRIEREGVITDITETKRIIRNNYEQLYALKLDKVEEKDK